MSAIMASAVSMGILSWMWAVLSGAIGVSTWAGFMGTTTYYASGERFIKGWVKGIIANMTGVLWAVIAIEVSKVVHISGIGAIMTGIVSFAMVAEAKWKKFSFIPGAFIGCATTFGIITLNGTYLSSIEALLMGSVVGIASDVGGVMIFKLTGKKESTEHIKKASLKNEA
ncbi:DUF1097 domain-containing protein [Clostridium sp. P21]|uniref:DUF1097 domain-containing protein n=1 Tax=Clostridium muellerianum TaxID=2716538 RepID=A0A7Y0EJZ3_9CLOT|nr:DUF1097 domain-containing protein [Clostridium muellerianum]NMM64868.1 DUF1097 domain-containing protein [Clostridium muellerianum]